MESINQNAYPKILVISNNPFSKTSNNGKTLASFFKEYPSENIAQLYFSSEIPNEDSYKNYFRISDIQVLKSMVTFASAGSKVHVDINKKSFRYGEASAKSITNYIKKSDFSRLSRELMWKSKKWKSNEITYWLNDFSPDIVFFCAGDTGFAYDIVSYVLDRTGAKLITYITDDYVLPRRTASILWRLRRNIIFKKMNRTISRSNLFITISEQMRKTYKELFKKDSIVALNMTESMKIDNFISENQNYNNIKLIYTGGLHFKRYETLSLLANAINKYNKNSSGKKAFLSIYSTGMLSDKVLNRLNIKGASEFLGGLDSKELKIKLNEADIPVHVESFDLKSIESTRLSISTKIPEYLSLGKPILAIGPEEVASMKYIADCAFCINSADNIYENLALFLNDNILQSELSEKAVSMFDYHHNSILSLDSLSKRIISLHQGEQ